MASSDGQSVQYRVGDEHVSLRQSSDKNPLPPEYEGVKGNKHV
jgi:hypothetical protein